MTSLIVFKEVKFLKSSKMYDFIDVVKLGIFINGLMAIVVGFFAVVKQIAVALDLFKSLD
jgi:hypothetical protein